MKIFDRLDDPELIELIRSGAVGILPTDTLYGLVARADNRAAVKRLYTVKKRDKKRGTTIAANTGQLIELGLDPKQIKRVAHLWPNSISVEIRQGPELAYIHQGTGTSAYRVVKDETLSRLLEQTGPLTTSSANQPEETPASSILAAQNYFGGQVDFYVDGGEIGDRPPSTIVRLTDAGDIEVIRQGVVKISEKGEVL